jgi:hypothetical protein
VNDIAEVSEAHTAFIFRTEVHEVVEFLCIYRIICTSPTQPNDPGTSGKILRIRLYVSMLIFQVKFSVMMKLCFIFIHHYTESGGLEL